MWDWELRIALKRILRMSPWTWWLCFSEYNNCFLIWWSEVRLSVAIWLWQFAIAAAIAAISALWCWLYQQHQTAMPTKLELPILGWSTPAPITWPLSCVWNFTRSRPVGALGGLNFVWVKLPKDLEISHCLSVASIVYGIISNTVNVPVCFRNVPGKILLPWRVVTILAEPCRRVPDCYDLEIPGSLG